MLVVAGPRQIPERQSQVARDHRAHQRRPFRVWPWRYFVLIARGARGRRSSRRWTAATSRERRTTGGRKYTPRRRSGHFMFRFCSNQHALPTLSHHTRSSHTTRSVHWAKSPAHGTQRSALQACSPHKHKITLHTHDREVARPSRHLASLPLPHSQCPQSLSPKLLPSYHTTHCCCCLQHFTRDGAYTAPSTGWLGSSLSNVLRCPSIAASVTLSMHAWASLVLPTEPPFPNQPPELHCTLSFFNSVMRSSKTSARRLKFSRRHHYIFTCTRGI